MPLINQTKIYEGGGGTEAPNSSYSRNVNFFSKQTSGINKLKVKKNKIHNE